MNTPTELFFLLFLSRLSTYFTKEKDYIIAFKKHTSWVTILCMCLYGHTYVCKYTYLCMYVHMCACMRACLCVRVCVCASTCMCTQVEARGLHQVSSSITLHLIYCDRVSCWTWCSLIQLHWLGSEPQGPSLSLLPSAKIRGIHH